MSSMEDDKHRILKHCSKDGWDDPRDKAIKEITLDKAIMIAKDFIVFAKNKYNVDVVEPMLFPSTMGGVNLEWAEKYTIMHTVREDGRQHGYGDNIGEDKVIHTDEHTIQVLKAYDEWGKNGVNVEIKDAS